METLMGAIGGVGFLACAILVLIWAVLWIVLPFAIFGSKDLLKQLIREQKRTNELLEMRRQARAAE